MNMKLSQKRMGKTGNVQFFLENAFRIGFMMIALLIFFLLINFYVNNKVDTQKLYAETVAYRIMSSDMIMLSDPQTGRVYTGIVDIEKLTDENIQSKFSYSNERHAAARIKLISNKIEKFESFEKEAYLNKAEFGYMKAFIDSGQKGRGSAAMFIKEFPVEFIKNGEKRFGTLYIEVIIPNS